MSNPNMEGKVKELMELKRMKEELEAEIAEKDALCEEYASDYQKLMEIGEEKEAMEAQLEELYELWEELNS